MTGSTSENLIKSKERIDKYGEVFTPQWVVNNMCDALEKENPQAFQPDSTFLEPACGDGVFILEILRRKFSRCKKRKDFTTALESVYGFEILADNVDATIRNITSLCEEQFRPTKAELQIIRDHVIQCDGLKVMKLLSVYGDHPPHQVNVFDYG